MSIAFDSTYLPDPTEEYVAWVDLMGCQAIMARSLHTSANFIYKLHSSALLSKVTSVRLYPVMDGFYATAVEQDDILNFLVEVFRTNAREFLRTTNDNYRYKIRCGLAFGQIIHGSAVPHSASQTLSSNATYRDSIIIGQPVVNAFLSERQAPPFGIFIHESARFYRPNSLRRLQQAWYKWGDPARNKLFIALRSSLLTHLDWCSSHSYYLDYDKSRIQQHKEMAEQYFS